MKMLSEEETMSKAMRFLLYADDLERAARFYTEVLGWEMKKAPAELGGDNHWFITAGPEDEPGLDGDLEKRVSNRTTVNHFRIPSYKETLEKIVRAGGKVLSEEPMGEMGNHAFCQDTEGNVFGVMWEKPPAR
jgi:predicted enzyme related to lactoylglutathione lyase